MRHYARIYSLDLYVRQSLQKSAKQYYVSHLYQKSVALFAQYEQECWWILLEDIEGRSADRRMTLQEVRSFAG
jgi:hypothetical protein